MNLDLLSASPYVALATPVVAIGVLIARWGRYKLDRGSATQKIVDSAAAAVKILRSECEELEKDLVEARKKAKSLTADLAGAQVEIADLRGQVDRMSKDLSAAHTELAQVRGEGRLP